MLSSGTSDTRGAVGAEWCVSGCVDIGWTDARGACELGGHTELRTHEIQGCLCSLGKRLLRMPGDKGYVKDGLNTESERKIEIHQKA